MKYILFLTAILFALEANAQNYLISFSGTGLSSVKVENLTSGLIANLNAGDVLHLSTATGISEVSNLKSAGLKIYPNPMTDKSTLEILPPVSGDAIISVYDISGKVITQFRGYLENYIQEFRLSGIENGLHVVNVQGKGYQFSEKLLSSGKTNGKAVIARVSNNIQTVAEKKPINDSKGSLATVDMDYNTGERLKYTAVSGNNSTVMTDIPIADKTVTFTFIECKDGNNNYYPIVKIGTQTWMAENLKTTKYTDNANITLVTDAAEWSNLTAQGYCWYNNNEATYKATYGALYNWYVVINVKLCPTGWHVPTDANWTSLTTFLVSVAGGKLKETGTAHWNSSNTGATNETGFTSLPGGYRYTDGSFNYIGKYGYWWAATEVSTANAYRRSMSYTNSNVNSTNDSKKYGFSIRCIKD